MRHGETAWNAEGRIQGHLDSPLNEEGMAQALLLAERLAPEPFDHFYSERPGSGVADGSAAGRPHGEATGP